MGKLAVVTGGTKGIGKAIIEKFASNGFDVATCARKEPELLALQKELNTRFPSIQALTVRADLSNAKEARSFADQVMQWSKDVDVLVNNAGYFSPGWITTEEEGVMETMMGANLYSAYYTTRAFVGSMKTRKQGHIFNICSIASLAAYPNGGAYTMSKFALLGFSKVLREELKESGIKVTAVMPGATRTSSWDAVALPEERFMKPSDVADAVFSAYSLSPRSVVEEIVIRPQLGDIK
jgi:short-subunit dehydrogenase